MVYKLLVKFVIDIFSQFDKFFFGRYHRGQPVFVEGRQMAKFSAVISAIGNETVSLN